MGNPKAAELAAALRMLPSTDDVLNSAAAVSIANDAGATRLTAIARAAVETLRKELSEAISKGAAHPEAYSKATLLELAAARLEAIWETRRRADLRRVINATGVVIHTNLGRAPLAPAARQALLDRSGYCTLEYDLATGSRGKRGAAVEQMLCELTGAEAALTVNNCAAAAFLVLTVFAKGGEAVVSRGELVEIGGDFRVPDVLAQSGAVMKEVGTTNRTKLADYEKAIGENTKVLMRVHPSNYRIVGFTEKPSLAALAELAHRKGILLYEDAGSGALVDLAKFGLDDEPLISRSIAEGADIVTFSGDKLLGASQAGLVVGRRDLVEQLRKHPLYRALRVDKLAYAALAATLEAYLRDDAEKNVPVLKMLGLTPAELEVRIRKLAERLRAAFDAATTLDVISGESVVGGGSAPDVKPETVLLAIAHKTLSAGEVEARLRSGETPVIARIEDGRVLVDLRAVDENEEDELLESLAVALAG